MSDYVGWLGTGQHGIDSAFAAVISAPGTQEPVVAGQMEFLSDADEELALSYGLQWVATNAQAHGAGRLAIYIESACLVNFPNTDIDVELGDAGERNLARALLRGVPCVALRTLSPDPTSRLARLLDRALGTGGTASFDKSAERELDSEQLRKRWIEHGAAGAQLPSLSPTGP